MRLLAIALTLALLPGAAAALSCAPPNPARELDAALREGREPRLLIGRLTTPFDNDDGRYRFDGRVLARGITIASLSSGIEVRASCAGQWCGELPRAPVEGLFISDHPSGGFRLVFGPCGGGHYAVPDEALLRALEGCLPAAGCPPETIEAFGRP